MNSELSNFVTGKNPPNKTANIRIGDLDSGYYEEVGVAWVNPDNGVTLIKFYGNQLINQPVYLFEKPYY